MVSFEDILTSECMDSQLKMQLLSSSKEFFVEHYAVSLDIRKSNAKVWLKVLNLLDLNQVFSCRLTSRILINSLKRFSEKVFRRSLNSDLGESLVLLDSDYVSTLFFISLHESTFYSREI